MLDGAVLPMLLQPATQCPIDVKCGTDIHTDTVTQYQGTTYVTRPAYSTTNHTITLTTTSLVVSVVTEVVTPVGELLAPNSSFVIQYWLPNPLTHRVPCSDVRE